MDFDFWAYSPWAQLFRWDEPIIGQQLILAIITLNLGLYQQDLWINLLAESWLTLIVNNELHINAPEIL